MEHWRAKTVETLLKAYESGYFPMGDNSQPGPIRWLSPDPRGIIPLTEDEGLHLPRRLRERVRSGRFEVTTDESFSEVVKACAAPRPPPGEQTSWIDDRILAAYTIMHELGHAHSIEAWLGTGESRRLVGGLYGVHIGAAFFAESKFHRADLGGTDASKVCLAHLITHLRRRGFLLLDVQLWNPHLDQFGCEEVPRALYMAKLGQAIRARAEWRPFELAEGAT